jgi:serine/threonine protein kinase
MTRAVADALSRLPLSQLPAERPSWSLRERLLLVRQLAQAVQALHRQGRLHLSLDAGTIAVDRQFAPQLPPPVGPHRFGGERSDPEFCPPELAQGPMVELPAEIEAAAAVLRGRGTPLDPRRIDVYQLGVLLCQLLTGEPFLNYLYSPTCKAKVPPMPRALLENCLGENAAGQFADCDNLVAALDDLIGQLPEEQAITTLETPPAGSVVVIPGDTPPYGETVLLPTEMTARENQNQERNQELPFQRLGHFRIVEQIGSGGMGNVYRGYDESLDRYVAIKVLPAELARDEDFVRRFQAEATAVAKVIHPNVVPIHFSGEDAGHQYFAMQFIEGESLAQQLAREKRLPAEQALAMIQQCLAGLEAAHRQGLVHRDIKPSNVLLEQSSGRAMLVDFGLVRRMDGGPRHTASGLVMGTVDYIAPEQARAQPVDGRADIYSLGVMFYQLLAGRLPFQADTPTTMIFQHAYEEPLPLDQAVPGVPRPLADIIARMMAKEPAERYPDCAAVLADIAAYRQGSLPSASRERGGGEGRITDDASLAAALVSLPQEARDKAAALPKQQVDELRRQLDQADATLASLRSQQHMLKARLQAAELHGPKRRRWVVPMAAGAAVSALLASLLIFSHARGPRHPAGTEEPAVSSGGTIQSTGGVLSQQQAYVIGNSPYYRTLADMAQRRGMNVPMSFNTQYDKWLPLARGHALIIETHDGTPVVPLSVLEKYYPNASDGLKAPQTIITIKDTVIIFVDLSMLLKEAASAFSGVDALERQAFIVGDSPYWETLADMAQQKGMKVSQAFNGEYDKRLPLAQGHILLVETHDGVPIVPLPLLDTVYSGASKGLKTPDGVATIGDTRIVFVDFSRLLAIPKHP